MNIYKYIHIYASKTQKIKITQLQKNSQNFLYKNQLNSF